MSCSHYYKGKYYSDIEDLKQVLKQEADNDLVDTIQADHPDKYDITDAQGFCLPEFLDEMEKGYGKDYGLGNIMKFQVWSLDDTGKPSNIKFSAAVLTDELCNSNPELANFRTLVRTKNKVLEASGKDPVHVMTFSSAIKVAGLKGDYLADPHKLLTDPNYELPETALTTTESKGIRMPFNPKHSTDSETKQPRQILYFLNVLGTNVEAANYVYGKLGELYEHRIKVHDSLVYDTKGNINPEGVNAFIKSVLSSESNAALLDMYEKATIRKPWDIPGGSSQIITGMSSLIDKSIRIVESKGAAAVLQSPFGAKRQAMLKNLSTEQRALIEKGLSMVMKKDSISGKMVMNMECLMPSGILPKDIEDDIRIKIKKGEDLPDILPYSDALGFRIPSSELHSAVALKVVGFYDSQGSNVIITGQQLVNLHGSDFDVDKLFIIGREVNRKYLHDRTPNEQGVSDYNKYMAIQEKVKALKVIQADILKNQDIEDPPVFDLYNNNMATLQRYKVALTQLDEKARLQGRYLETMVGYDEQVTINRDVDHPQLNKLQDMFEDYSNKIEIIKNSIAKGRTMITDNPTHLGFKKLERLESEALKNFEHLKTLYGATDTRTKEAAKTLKVATKRFNVLKESAPNYLKLIDNLKAANDELKKMERAKQEVYSNIKMLSSKLDVVALDRSFKFDKNKDTKKMSSMDREKYIKNAVLEEILSAITDERNFVRMNKAITFKEFEDTIDKFNAYTEGVGKVFEHKLSLLNSNIEDSLDEANYNTLLQDLTDNELKLAKSIIKAKDTDKISKLINTKEDLDLSDPLDNLKAKQLVGEGLKCVGIEANFLGVFSYLARAGREGRPPMLWGAVRGIEDILHPDLLKDNSIVKSLVELKEGEVKDFQTLQSFDGVYRIGDSLYRLTSQQIKSNVASTVLAKTTDNENITDGEAYEDNIEDSKELETKPIESTVTTVTKLNESYKGAIQDIDQYGALFKIGDTYYNQFVEYERTGSNRDIYTFLDGALNAALDNVKAQVLPNLNFTQFTLPLVNGLAALGVSQDTIKAIMKQPSLMYLTTYMQNVKKNQKLSTLKVTILDMYKSITGEDFDKANLSLDESLLLDNLHKKYSLKNINNIDKVEAAKMLANQLAAIDILEKVQALNIELLSISKVLSLFKDTPIKTEDLDKVKEAINTISDPTTLEIKPDFALSIPNFFTSLPHVKALVKNLLNYSKFIDSLFTQHSPQLRAFSKELDVMLDYNPHVSETLKRNVIMKYLVSSAFDVSDDRFVRTIKGPKGIRQEYFTREEAFVNEFTQRVVELQQLVKKEAEFEKTFPDVDPLFIKTLFVDNLTIKGIMDNLTPLEMQDAMLSFKTLNKIDFVKNSDYTTRFVYNPSVVEGTYNQLQMDFIKYLNIRYGGVSTGLSFGKLIDPEIYNAIYTDKAGVGSYYQRIQAKFTYITNPETFTKSSKSDYLHSIKNDIELNIRLGELKATKVISKVPSNYDGDSKRVVSGLVEHYQGDIARSYRYDLAYMGLNAKQMEYFGNYIIRNEGSKKYTIPRLYKLLTVNGINVGEDMNNRYYVRVGDVKSSNYFKTLNDAELFPRTVMPSTTGLSDEEVQKVAEEVTTNSMRLAIRKLLHSMQEFPLIESPKFDITTYQTSTNYQSDYIFVKNPSDLLNVSAWMFKKIPTSSTDVYTYEAMSTNEVANFFDRNC